MTDLEISKALALAIGWKPEQMRLPATHRDGMQLEIATNYGDCWRVFSYRDWNVIGPIAARHNCFPVRITSRLWLYKNVTADTPQKAIALAVIARAVIALAVIEARK